MNFIVEENRVYLNDENGTLIAEVTFPAVDKNTVNMNHTFVDSSLRGKGIASELIERAALKLRKENKKVIPTCSYAVKWFAGHEEYKDILKN